MNDELVVVGIAEGKTACQPGVLVSYALGSCVGVCLYDYKNKIAGMVHILLPCREVSLEQKNPFKFADSGIRQLVENMEKIGAARVHLHAKIVGGARMFCVNGTAEGIGERNIAAVKKNLRKLGIILDAEDTGKNYGRTIYFHSSTGMLQVKSVKQETKWI